MDGIARGATSGHGKLSKSLAAGECRRQLFCPVYRPGASSSPSHRWNNGGIFVSFDGGGVEFRWSCAFARRRYLRLGSVVNSRTHEIAAADLAGKLPDLDRGNAIPHLVFARKG